MGIGIGKLMRVVNLRRLLKEGAIVGAPFLLWSTLFSMYKLLPPQFKRDVSTYGLVTVEHIMFGDTFDPPYNHTLYKDVLAAFVYTIHALLPFVTVIYFWFRDFKKIKLFLSACGICTLMAFVLQCLMPTAPPWFLDIHGDDAHLNANYTVTGDAAGLRRLEGLIGSDVYQNAYKSSPMVFASFPSVHVLWPTVMLLCNADSITVLLNLIHVIVITWASIYLRHHYMIDAIGSYMCAFVGVIFAKIYVRTFISKPILKNNINFYV